MLNYSIAFVVMAIIAAFFGFGRVAPGLQGVAKLMFYIFLLVAMISIVADVFYFK